MKKFFYSVILVLLLLPAIVLILPLAEHAARYYYRDITTTGDAGSYFSKNWLLQEFGRDLVKLNSWRTREGEFEVNKPDGVFRIVVIGDSLTFGQGIAEDDRFTDLIEERLNKNESMFEVLNLGRMGAQPIDEIRMLKKLTAETTIDFVLLQWFVNDFEGYDYSHRPDPKNVLPWREYHDRYRRHSVIYFVLNTMWHRFQAAAGKVETYADYMVRRFGDSDSQSTKLALNDVREFIRHAKSANVPVAIVLFPFLMPELADDYSFDFMHEYVLQVCEQETIQCLDLRDVYRPYAEDVARLHVNQFDAHPSAFANKLAAEAIMDAFAAQWIEQADAAETVLND
ncbi:MAG: GDSL-type esterase/lipase family protein [Gammaproteobacteria bacterium]|nr:GDSL-type esterase/lipase family protein [Gammaproteobacteria bacterium]